MNQKSLFNMTPQTKTIYGTEREAPIARRSDPETSKQSAAEVDTETDSEILMRGFEFYGAKGATAKEAASVACPRGKQVDDIRKRYTNLLKQGRIEKSGTKKCLYTGKTATVYRIKEA